VAEKKPKSQRYVYSAASDRGSIRERNEDYYGIFVPDTEEAADRLGILAVVSDGMGGHFSGAEASRTAVETIGLTYFEGSDASVSSIVKSRIATPSRRAARERHSASVVNNLRWSILEANRQVFETVGEGHNGMAGTTCTAIVFLPETMHIAHAGDSRAYLARDGELRQLTDDHSVVGEMVRKGMISRKDANKHPQRNIITRAVGLRGQLDIDVEESIPVQPGDRVLLCTDGLFSMLDEDEILEIAAQGTPQKACDKLVRRAKEEGGVDNITVIIMEKVR
jgi:serine/threonine protein phosphatase PrpC